MYSIVVDDISFDEVRTYDIRHEDEMIFYDLR